jgi:hypothetical protein
MKIVGTALGSKPNLAAIRISGSRFSGCFHTS